MDQELSDLWDLIYSDDTAAADPIPGAADPEKSKSDVNVKSNNDPCGNLFPDPEYQGYDQLYQTNLDQNHLQNVQENPQHHFQQPQQTFIQQIPHQNLQQIHQQQIQPIPGQNIQNTFCPYPQEVRQFPQPNLQFNPHPSYQTYQHPFQPQSHPYLQQQPQYVPLADAGYAAFEGDLQRMSDYKAIFQNATPWIFDDGKPSEAQLKREVIEISRNEIYINLNRKSDKEAVSNTKNEEPSKPLDVCENKTPSEENVSSPEETNAGSSDDGQSKTPKKVKITVYKDSEKTFYPSLDDGQRKSLLFLKKNPNTSELSSRILFWKFILYLLDNPINRGVEVGISWDNREKGAFFLNDIHLFAELWGHLSDLKTEPLAYMSKCFRHYKNMRIFSMCSNRKFHFQFSQKALKWSERTNIHC